MRIAVMGPGAVGLLWAARLSLAGRDVTLWDHNPDRAARLLKRGIMLEDASGSRQAFPKVASPPLGPGDSDLVLLCVKAYDTEQAARELKEFIPKNARVLTLQNGAGNLEVLAGALGPRRVLGGATSEGATLLAEGRVRHGGAGVTNLGPYQPGGSTGFCVALAEIFQGAGFRVNLSDSVMDLVWTKLVINVGINPLSALFEVPNGRLLDIPRARVLMKLAVEEATKVGGRLGINFLYNDMIEAVKEVARKTKDNLSSMLQDLTNNKRTEVEFINGVVESQARRLGMSAPVNRSLTQLVLSLEQKNQEF